MKCGAVSLIGCVLTAFWLPSGIYNITQTTPKNKSKRRNRHFIVKRSQPQVLKDLSYCATDIFEINIHGKSG